MNGALSFLFPDVRSSELHRFRFFFVLAGLLMASQATAMTVCESLLLSRLGIEALPYSVLAASALTMGCSYLYSQRVGRARHESTMLILIGLAVLVVGLSFPLVLARYKAAYVGIFAFHFVTFSLFSGHLQALANDYFDTLASKRVMPLVGVGATAGEIAGGLCSSAVTKVVSIEALMGVWILFLILAAAFILKNREELRLWNPSQTSGADETRDVTKISMLGLLKTAPLNRSLLGTVCCMVLTMSMVQYVVSDVFVASFPNENKLASFLGVFVACSNALELLLASQVTPRLLKKLGVAKTNTIHSILALITLSLLWNQYTLIPAMLAWANRKTVHDALAGPVRRLLFNACPNKTRISLMAFISGVAGSAARAVASLLLFVMQNRLEARTFILWGLGFAALYLFFSLVVGGDYLQALKEQVEEGRLRLDAREVWKGEELTLLWYDCLCDPKEQELRRLAGLLDSQDHTEVLLESLSHTSALVRRICAEQLGVRCPESCLDDTDDEVRLAACTAHWQNPEKMKALLTDANPAVRQRAEAACGELKNEPTPDQIRFLHFGMLDKALECLEHSDSAYQIAALHRLSGEFCVALERIFRKIQDPRVEVSVAAVQSLAGWSDPMALVLLSRTLEHERARTRQAASQALAGKGASALAHLKPYFRSERKVVAEAAFDALSGLDDPEVRETLGQELRLLVREAWKSLILYHRAAVLGEESLSFLSRALLDRSEKYKSLAFKVLSLLEDDTVVGSVVNALRFSDAGKRATALEILSNLGDREAAGLLVLLTENSPLAERLTLAQKESSSLAGLPHQRDKLLALCLQSSDRFVTLGALSALQRSASPLPAKLLALSGFEIFSGLSLEELMELEALLVEERFSAGSPILESGETYGKLYLLISGRLSDGATVAGEVGIMDGGPEVATVTAQANSRLWSLSGDDFRRLIKHQPSVAFPLIRRMVKRVKEKEASGL